MQSSGPTEVSRQAVAPRYDRLNRPEPLAALRRFFRQMNRGMILLWRLGLGRFAEIWPGGFGRLLVIEHVGRRSGTAYRTPVNFTIDGNDIVCVAAFGDRTDWYRNALAKGTISVWLQDGRWEATVEDISDDAARLGLMRRVLIDSGFAAPLFGLHPRRGSDEELAEATAEYRLVRIRRVRRSREDFGYSDLAWVWPVGLGVLIAWRLARRAR
ncbi:MAG: nitroreductase family deazaflavin-dependent oxidoreductase [Acidimicrobiia bacterium]